MYTRCCHIVLSSLNFVSFSLFRSSFPSIIVCLYSDHPIISFRVISYKTSGGNHNLALSDSGDIYTWGYGEMLALGNGAERDELVPRKINLTKAKIPSIVASQVAGGGQHSAIIGTVTQFSS